MTNINELQKKRQDTLNESKEINEIVNKKLQDLAPTDVDIQAYINSDEVYFKVQHKTNWTNFLTVYLKTEYIWETKTYNDDIKFSYSHGTGGFNTDVPESEKLDATISMFNYIKEIESIKDEFLGYIQEIRKLSETRYEIEREIDEQAQIDKEDEIKRTHKEITIQEVIELDSLEEIEIKTLKYTYSVIKKGKFLYLDGSKTSKKNLIESFKDKVLYIK